MRKQGQQRQADQIERFGLTDDGSIAGHQGDGTDPAETGSGIVGAAPKSGYDEWRLDFNYGPHGLSAAQLWAIKHVLGGDQ